MGSRSVTGHCNRSGRDARVILRGASLGDVYEARWWPDWTGTGWRTGNCAVVSRDPDQRPPRGLQPAGRWPGAGRAGRRGTVAMLARSSPQWACCRRGSADQCRASAGCLDRRRSARAALGSRSWLVGPVRPYARVEGKRTITPIAPDPGSAFARYCACGGRARIL
jgi:hypothetical protein